MGNVRFLERENQSWTFNRSTSPMHRVDRTLVSNPSWHSDKSIRLMSRQGRIPKGPDLITVPQYSCLSYSCIDRNSGNRNSSWSLKKAVPLIHVLVGLLRVMRFVMAFPEDSSSYPLVSLKCGRSYFDVVCTNDLSL